MKYLSSTRTARRTLAIASLLMALSVIFVGVAYAAQYINIDQCQNGAPPTGSCSWITGILNPGANTYFEGMATPQRFLMGNLTGASHTITFDMQWTKAGKHAYDFPVSWAQAQTLATNIGHFSMNVFSNRCANYNPGDTTDCNAATITQTQYVPTDTYISGQYALPATDGSMSSKIAAFAAVYGPPQIQIVSDQPITFTIQAPVHDMANGADTGDSKVTYTINVTKTGATNPTVLLMLFAAHISISDAPGDPSAPLTTWGQGTGAKNISGAPYHVQSPTLDGSGGSQDNQLNLAGDPQTPTLVTAISKTSMSYGSTVSDTLTMSLSKSEILSGYVAFYICGPGAAVYYCLPTNNVSRTLVSTHNISTTASSVVQASSTYRPTANGYWCFLAQWINQDYHTQSYEAFITTNECVQVTSATAVKLSSFRPEATPTRGSVALAWTTASEVNTAGYNVYRAESAGGPFVRINAQLIPASSESLVGDKYRFVDASAIPGNTYYYQLEDIETNGKSTVHPPIQTTAAMESKLDENMLFLIGSWVAVLGLVISRILDQKFRGS